MTNPRFLAYQVLLNIENRLSHPDRLVHATLSRHSSLKGEDRALMTELVYGVLRWQGRLDWHIDQLSRTKPQKIDPGVRILLRIAFYQILFLQRIPQHAAVNETVRLVKMLWPSHVAGFANALLREALRIDGNWNWPGEGDDPVGFLAVTTSHPRWMVERAVREWGFEEARALLEANNTVAPIVLRLNPLKTNRGDLFAVLRSHGLEPEPSPYLSDAVRISGARRDVSKLPVFQDGWVQVQDEASQLVVCVLDPQPGERVLDVGAGFGGKSTAMAIQMRNEGRVVALDRSSWKLEELLNNAARQGVHIIRTVAGDILEVEKGKMGLFDRVLVDAPCSGLGTLRRNPDIKWRRHPKDPYRFSRIQKDLLERSSEMVRPGGVLVYATCTVTPEENEGVTGDFGRRHPEWKLETVLPFLPRSCLDMVRDGCLQTWPHRHGVDGFFCARWRRDR